MGSLSELGCPPGKRQACELSFAAIATDADATSTSRKSHQTPDGLNKPRRERKRSQVTPGNTSGSDTTVKLLYLKLDLHIHSLLVTATMLCCCDIFVSVLNAPSFPTTGAGVIQQIQSSLDGSTNQHNNESETCCGTLLSNATYFTDIYCISTSVCVCCLGIVVIIFLSV